MMIDNKIVFKAYKTEQDDDNFFAYLHSKLAEMSIDQLTEVEMAVWAIVRERLHEQGFEEH